MRLSCFGQRKFFSDDRTQRSVFQTGHERGVNACQLCRRRIRKDHPAHIGIALHRVPRIDFDRAAAPDDHNAPRLCENGQIAAEIHVCEHFHDYINTFVDELGPLFDQVVVLMQDAPRTPVQEHRDEFFAYLERIRLQPDLFYSSYPNLSVQNILTMKEGWESQHKEGGTK